MNLRDKIDRRIVIKLIYDKVGNDLPSENFAEILFCTWFYLNLFFKGQVFAV